MNIDLNGRSVKKKNRWGVYLIPSFFTLANLTCGFFSLLWSSNGKYAQAAWIVLAAAAFDILDGWAARITKTISSFGGELDSLADFLSFGIAPSFLMYRMLLRTYGKLGMIISLLFVIAGALRLARYNTKDEENSVVLTGSRPRLRRNQRIRAGITSG